MAVDLARRGCGSLREVDFASDPTERGRNAQIRAIIGKWRQHCKSSVRIRTAQAVFSVYCERENNLSELEHP